MSTARRQTTFSITCLHDGLAHHVPDTELCAPMGVRTGCYTAVCGHLVVAGSMMEPEGRACALCTEVLLRAEPRARHGWAWT